jgi:hypothetical protein
MTNERMDQIEEILELSDETRKFLQTKVGLHLVAKAEADKSFAMRRLVGVDPDDKKEIVRLQLMATTPSLVLHWLNQAISDADKLTEELATY